MVAIQEFPCPAVVKELQALLGMINLYRRFLPGIARTLCPFTDELSNSRKGKEKLLWLESMETAFNVDKQALLFATHLAVGPNSDW